MGLASVGCYGQYWHVDDVTSPTAWIYPHWEFSKGADDDFFCNLLMDLVNAFAVFAPEFAIGDIELGGAVELICKDTED